MVPLEKVCGVPMGGLPGTAPTLLVGSMFFDRQKLVVDPTEGEFDHDGAKDLLNMLSHWSEKTGNPAAVDVVASTPRAMRRYLDFVTSHFDGPIMVDGSDGAVKIAGLEHMAERDLIRRVIYNSISHETSADEYAAIEKSGVKAAVLLAMNPGDFSTQGKLDLLQGESGLVAKAKALGLDHLLVDPGIIDLLSVGTAKETIGEVRNMGCLAGAAPHNAFGSWGGLTEKFGTDFKSPASAVLNALPTAWGADFVIFGPIPLAPVVFPAVAMVDAMLAQPLMDQGQIPEPTHPMFRIA